MQEALATAEKEITTLRQTASEAILLKTALQHAEAQLEEQAAAVADYPRVVAELEAMTQKEKETHDKLAAKAFECVTLAGEKADAVEAAEALRSQLAAAQAHAGDGVCFCPSASAALISCAAPVHLSWISQERRCQLHGSENSASVGPLSVPLSAALQGNSHDTTLGWCP